MTLTIEKTDRAAQQLVQPDRRVRHPGLGAGGDPESGTDEPGVGDPRRSTRCPLLLSSTETALLMLVTGISGENTYMSVATATGAPNTLSQPAAQRTVPLHAVAERRLLPAQRRRGDDHHPSIRGTRSTSRGAGDQRLDHHRRHTQPADQSQQQPGRQERRRRRDRSVFRNDPARPTGYPPASLNQGHHLDAVPGCGPGFHEQPHGDDTGGEGCRRSRTSWRVIRTPRPEQLDYDRAQQIAERQAGYDGRYTV